MGGDTAGAAASAEVSVGGGAPNASAADAAGSAVGAEEAENASEAETGAAAGAGSAAGAGAAKASEVDDAVIGHSQEVSCVTLL